MDLDDSQIMRLIGDIGHAEMPAFTAAAAAVGVAADVIRDGMIADARATMDKRLRKFAPSIKSDHHGLEAEIGTERRGQGNFAPIVYGGTSTTPPIAPMPDPHVKLAAEKLSAAVGVAIEQVARGKP